MPRPHSTPSQASVQEFLDRVIAGAGADGPARGPFASGVAGLRQPVHTVYGGAHLFGPDAVAKIGARAKTALLEHAGTPSALSTAFGLNESAADDVFGRVVQKLEREPVEDLRIDFEDGYGVRSESEEDEHAQSVGRVLATLPFEELAPPFVGIRLKALGDAPERAIRTLDLCITEIAKTGGGRLPNGFVVTLPKVEDVVHVRALDRTLLRIERSLGLGDRAIPIELMIESPALFDPKNPAILGSCVDAAEGRCRGFHFGVYDYLSSLGVSAFDQRMRHPLLDFARHAMLVGLAAADVWISDGVTNVLPLPVHRGDSLSDEKRKENSTRVSDAWRLHRDDVRHSLSFGIFQGWDVHPAQLVSRYVALYTYYREALPLATARLASFLAALSKATRVGSVFDDAATGRGLLSFFARGYASLAISSDECRKAGLLEADLVEPDLGRVVARARASAAASGEA